MGAAGARRRGGRRCSNRERRASSRRRRRRRRRKRRRRHRVRRLLRGRDSSVSDVRPPVGPFDALPPPPSEERKHRGDDREPANPRTTHDPPASHSCPSLPRSPPHCPSRSRVGATPPAALRPPSSPSPPHGGAGRAPQPVSPPPSPSRCRPQDATARAGGQRASRGSGRGRRPSHCRRCPSPLPGAGRAHAASGGVVRARGGRARAALWAQIGGRATRGLCAAPGRRRRTRWLRRRGAGPLGRVRRPVRSLHRKRRGPRWGSGAEGWSARAGGATSGAGRWLAVRCQRRRRRSWGVGGPKAERKGGVHRRRWRRMHRREEEKDPVRWACCANERE